MLTIPTIPVAIPAISVGGDSWDILVYAYDSYTIPVVIPAIPVAIPGISVGIPEIPVGFLRFL